MLRNLIYFLVIQIVIIFTIAQKQQSSIQQDPDTAISYRLPNNTIPLEYDLTIRTRIDLGQFNFTGTVQILIHAIEFTNNITLHYQSTTTIVNVLIQSTSLPIQEILSTDFIYNNLTQLFVINVPSGLQANTNYTLTINYEGELRNDYRGFYRSSYIVNGVQRWLATTQFEPTAARHGFPCYDEPAIKATFKVRVQHGPTYTALSNMPATSQSPIFNSLDGTHTTDFEVTPLISSYLITFLISDFAYLSNLNNKNSSLPQRVFGRANRVQEGEFMLRNGQLILDAIADYVSTPYSLPKLDQAAIPGFRGAIENWGLITHQEGLLYFNKSTDLYFKKMAAVLVIAHEFSHQWFGNLVGPKWWTYLWLNEGFANLFQHIATDLVYPDWKIMDYYVVHTLQDIFISDALPTARPMTHYAESNTAVMKLFNTIAYDKSSCVLRMFMHALTEPSFKKGLRYYLADRRLSSATEEDLFAALNKAAQEDNILPDGLDIEKLMSTWTRQSGFPLLRVIRNYTTGDIHLSQQRYFSSPQLTTDHTVYAIPYNFYTNQSSLSIITNTKADYWLQTKDSKLPASKFTNLTENDWILFNNQETGYYRILYDENNYELIALALQTPQDRSKIHLVSRAQLFDDSYDLIRTNSLSCVHFLNLTKYLQNETEYVPWRSASKGISVINRRLSGHKLHPRFMKYLSTRVENFFNTVGVEDIENEAQPLKYARPIAISLACKNDNQLCLDAIKAKLKDLIDNNHEFHQNVRSELYCATLRIATSDEYWFVWNRLLSSTSAEYRSQLISALGCSLNEKLLIEYLQFSLSSTTINDTIILNAAEQLYIFNAVYENSAGARHIALEFLIAHIDEASERWDNFSDVLFDIALFITNEALRVKFTILLELVETNEYATMNAIEEARELVRKNAAWETKHVPTIASWLEENFPNSDT